MKLSMKKDGAIQFKPTKNTNTFIEGFPKSCQKVNSNSTKQYYMNIEKNCHNYELCNAALETITKIFACLDTSKAPGLDGISSKFLKDDAEVLALPLCNLENL